MKTLVMNSIRARLTAIFVIVIVVTVGILEALLIYIVKQNYYNSLEGSLINQIKISADLYAKYFSDASLQENVLYNVDAFWSQTNAQVEIADKSGTIIMDSLGAMPSGKVDTTDLTEALVKGKTGTWVGSLNGEKVMAVSHPLKTNNEIVGALRFITSLREVDQDISKLASIFILIGALVVLIAGLISVFLANTIVVPLKEVTEVAKKMAAGNFKTRSLKRREDEIGKLSDTLNYMADEIVKREQLKNEFISSVSHELRTPLTSIMGWAITLQNENLQTQEMLADGLGIIAKESERLTLMVEELLDFSKFVSGQIRLHNQESDLASLMDQIEKQFGPRAVRDKIVFNVHHPENLPPIITDGNRFKQLFINLLDNAFNFTEAGGQVRLSVEVRSEDFLFCVSDTGCGIPKDELPRVKEKFFKGKSSRSRNGIGLSICQEIVDLMGGTLEITSEVNVGTKAYVVIPRGAENA